MISQVVIENFKSIGESGVDLELKPLTLLVGPNGGGKSSILEAIAVASQNSPKGKLVSFPSWDSVMHRQSGSKSVIDVYFDWPDQATRPGRRFGSLGHGSIADRHRWKCRMAGSRANR